MKSFVSVLILLSLCGSAVAQQIKVEDFRKASFVKVEGKGAVVDLETDESGFIFTLVDGTALEPKQMEGFVRIIVPKKTVALKIEHPEYGQYYWKVPLTLRNYKHYAGFLYTDSPDKKLKITKQWLTFEITPLQSVVAVDDTLVRVREGQVKFFLPVGTHKYNISAPFHDSVADSVVLDDTGRKALKVTLQSFYSFVTVRSDLNHAQVLFDLQPSESGNATSERLVPGLHRVTLRAHGYYYVDTVVNLGMAQKCILDFRGRNLPPKVWYDAMKARSLADLSGSSPDAYKDGSVPVIKAPVTIRASVDTAGILLNRELVGTGSWSGELPVGFYAVGTRVSGKESSTKYVEIRDNSPKEILLGTVDDAYGNFNIDCNVLNADVYIDDVPVGITPCIIENLVSARSYKITLKKDGYRDAVENVTARGNYMKEVKLKLKKR